MGLDAPIARDLYLSSQVDQTSINDLSKKIVEINSNDKILVNVYAAYGLEYKPKPINIYIDSYGGWVYQCYGLLGIMKSSQVPIHTIVTGCAMSCGFFISIAGHKRFAYKHSTFLYHQISTGQWGTVKDVEEGLAETKRLQKILERHVLDNTKISKGRLREVYDAKLDWFINPEEAIELGVIDKII